MFKKVYSSRNVPFLRKRDCENQKDIKKNYKKNRQKNELELYAM